ncbi:hypothetical protein BS47DRAFT_1360149 [Hydnum rufescens UP504]|uniref:GED domain-containing protein n=1 Tax=Hydnum rufescens UP504 TaxID=1448309 RepID=A0A9P6DZG2_9AGAM|nr:hypothetical protein BS47DRAFT_1360149 [Hydnum rufescens UP504]
MDNESVCDNEVHSFGGKIFLDFDPKTGISKPDQTCSHTLYTAKVVSPHAEICLKSDMTMRLIQSPDMRRGVERNIHDYRIVELANRSEGISILKSEREIIYHAAPAMLIWGVPYHIRSTQFSSLSSAFPESPAFDVFCSATKTEVLACWSRPLFLGSVERVEARKLALVILSGPDCEVPDVGWNLAILNPSVPPPVFVDFNLDSLEDGVLPLGSTERLGVSSNVVCLDVSGSDVPELSFIDLPGSHIEPVKNMIMAHVQGLFNSTGPPWNYKTILRTKKPATARAMFSHPTRPGTCDSSTKSRMGTANLRQSLVGSCPNRPIHRFRDCGLKLPSTSRRLKTNSPNPLQEDYITRFRSPPRAIVLEELKYCKREVSDVLIWLIEDPPYTQNEHYFSSYRDQYLAEYRKERSKQRTNEAAAAQAPTYLKLAGYNIESVVELAKFDRPDLYEWEMIVTAGVRAYFRVVYKRIIENILRIIDRNLTGKLVDPPQKVLYSPLQTGTEEGLELAARLMTDDPSVALR